MKETVREMLECPEAVAEVLSCVVTPGRVQWDEGKVKMPLNVRVLCRGERGGTVSVSRRLNSEISAASAEGVLLSAVGRCGEPYAAVASGALELRIPVEVELRLEEPRRIPLLDTLELDTDSPLETCGRPSVTVVQRKDLDLWSLAKKYGSTLELIHAANPQCGEDTLFLLIPRCR